MKITQNSFNTVRFAGTACWVALCLQGSAAQFADVTASAGLTNENGYCVSAAWGDYDNDQFIDLYLAIGADAVHVNALYRNNGNGTFSRVGPEAGPITMDSHDSQGAAWIDFNNDGYRDMFVNNGGWSASRNDLYWNNGDGTFHRSGDAGNLTKLSKVRSWSACADYDGDGWVDLYVAEGDSWSSPFATRLYHATGTGTFESVDFGPTVTYANDGAWGDYDNDGDPDLFVCNYESPSLLYRNDGGGKFTAMTNGLPSNLRTLHVAWADYDRDGDLDIALMSWSGTHIYRNGGSGFDLAITLSAAAAGGAWADYDNDGYVDFLGGCGQGSPRKMALYHNNGDGTFSEVDEVFTTTADYWMGSPWGDFDNDGFMDVFFANEKGANRLFRNLGNTNHWIKFKLIGTASNRDAIGAKIRVKATIGGQSVWQMQEVNGGYEIQNDTRLNFGLGDATNVDLVRIEWPSGNVQELNVVAIDRIQTVTEQAYITPVRPTASLGGSVTLTASRNGSWQWYRGEVPLEGKTNKTLSVANLAVADGGRYSVVTSNLGIFYTNSVYLRVDPTFTKITGQPVADDHGVSVGGSWADYDNDGYPDLYVVNLSGGINSLYRNNRDGTFTKVLTNALLSLPSGWSAVWGDYDNDNDPDLFVPADGATKDSLLRNEGSGVFLKMPAYAGGPADDTSQTMAASWADVDRDGWLDLFVGCYGAQNDRLYRNLGNGTLRRLTAAEAGDAVADGADTASGLWADYDNDGDDDLFIVMYDVGRHCLYRNDGTGRLLQVPASEFPRLGGSYRVAAWGDYDNDGDFDLFETGFNVRHALYHNKGNGTFTNLAVNAGFGSPLSLAMGSSWGDYDNDGDLDLFVTTYDGNNALYQNQGDGTFRTVDVGSPLVDGTGRTDVGWVDYDRDGFLDLFVGCQNSVNGLYHNNLRAAGNTNRWLEIGLKGTASNASAIGAKIRVKAFIGGAVVWQLRQVESSFLTHDLVAHFGLGDATNVDLVRIEWPSGNVQELNGVAIDTIQTVTEQAYITPERPTASLGGSVTLTASRNGSWQWYHGEVLLEGKTNKTLSVSNLAVADGGRYSVVVDTGSGVFTNYAYLFVDTQFSKITEGPLVTDEGCSWGASWGDYDGDGLVDLFVTRNTRGLPALYQNNGGGTFTAVPTASLPSTADTWASAAWADFDNDGRPDLVMTRYNQSSFFLYFNNGDGTFTSLQLAGVSVWGIAVADYNHDGLVDLFLSSGSTVPNVSTYVGVLYRNNGDRTFTKVTAKEAGAIAAAGGLGAATWADFDDDAQVELYYPHYDSHDLILDDDGTGSFVSVSNLVTQSSAVAGTWGDFDNDGRLDLCAVDYGQPSYVYRNLGNGQFERATIGVAISGGFQSASCADYDNDGFLDLFLAGQGNQLYHNSGDGSFTRITTGSIVTDSPINGNPFWSYGALWFDYDNDGFLDLYVCNGDDPRTANVANFLYHNEGNNNAWLKVKLIGTTSNRDAVGAKVRARATYAGQGRWQRRDITGGDSYNGNHLIAHFGLGTAKIVSTLRIEWPSGTVQELTNVAVNQTLTVTEPVKLVPLGPSEFQINCWQGMRFEVEKSHDFQNWQSLGTVTNVTGTLIFQDTVADPGTTSCFYRVKSK